MATGKEKVYVVEVDTSSSGLSGDINCYHERRCDADFFQKSIVNKSNILCCQSRVATLCGRNITLYFSKYREGLAKLARNGGERAVMAAVAAQPDLFSKNNGAATFLLMEPDVGLSEYIVCGRAYIVEDDGQAPLSKGQVWGLQEMVNCAMNIYDMDPENMAEGKRTVEEWAQEYREGTWIPRSGTGGIDIYSSR